MSERTSEVVVLQFFSPERDNLTAWLQLATTRILGNCHVPSRAELAVFENLRYASQRRRIVERAEGR